MTQKLEEAKRLYETANADQKYVLEKLFPELKESEGERIRKDIISYLQHEKVVKRNIGDLEYDKWIAWLEKQGLQNKWKPSDEQMKALDDVISSRNIRYDILSELWKDLNKLKE